VARRARRPRADVCLVLMDGRRASPSKTSASSTMCGNRHGMVLVWSKWDLVEDKEPATARWPTRGPSKRRSGNTSLGRFERTAALSKHPSTSIASVTAANGLDRRVHLVGQPRSRASLSSRGPTCSTPAPYPCPVPAHSRDALVLPRVHASRPVHQARDRRQPPDGAQPTAPRCSARLPS